MYHRGDVRRGVQVITWAKNIGLLLLRRRRNHGDVGYSLRGNVLSLDLRYVRYDTDVYSSVTEHHSACFIPGTACTILSGQKRMSIRDTYCGNKKLPRPATSPHSKKRKYFVGKGNFGKLNLSILAQLHQVCPICLCQLAANGRIQGGRGGCIYYLRRGPEALV